MAVGRRRARFSLFFIAAFIAALANSGLAWKVKEETEEVAAPEPEDNAPAKDDDNKDDLEILAECKARVVKALDQYWGSSKDDDDDADDDNDKDDSKADAKNDDDDDDDDNEPSAKRAANMKDDDKDDDDDDNSDEKKDDDDNDNDSKEKKNDEDNDDDDDDKKESEKDDDDDKKGSEKDDDDDGKIDDGDDDDGDGDSGPNEGENVESGDGEEQEEITQAEVQEIASADDFVEEAEDEAEEEELEEMEVPKTGRDHIDKIMDLNEEDDEIEKAESKLISSILKDMKHIHDQTIKPVEQLYKYRDISTRRFADAEIYSQPMVLFVGPWNSGKSTMINYLLGIEGTEMALETGAASKGSQFIVLTHGDKEKPRDGTEIAADWRFAGIQKFGQGFIDALVGTQLPRKFLEKITIVEAPGIRESQKNLDYPFDDSLQWFIDRADIIYVVFDPTKLEMGHEMELLMDQLKGREKYLRFLLNKADTVDTESIMKVTSQLFWTLSPMLSTPVVPISYSVSLWSKPYQEHSDGNYLSDQEVDMLRDLKKNTMDKLVENKLAHARRHAVTVRNHAKLVDCYLTHYYKHKSLFANKNQVANEIINNPDKYKIFESLSMLNNVSRYDLPNPEIYKEFFKVTPLYDFKQLKNTCSYFKGCPLDKLNNCIAYDVPQLLGKYKKHIKEIREKADDKKD